MRVRFHALAFGGEAVGRAEGQTEGPIVFAPFTAPGDVADVRITVQKKRFLRAEVIGWVEQSPLRVAPPCPYFGHCGGCQWQHVPRETQLVTKQAIVTRALGIPTEPILAPGPEYGYRWRTRQRWEGKILGYRGWRNHHTMDIDRCLLLPEVFDRQIQGARRALHEPAELHAQMGRGGEVAIRCGNVCLGPETVDVADENEPAFLIAAGGFAQPSAAGNRLLRQVVAQASQARPGLRVLELYAGAGNFTRDLVAAGAEVTAVESAPVPWFVPGAKRLVIPAERAVLTPERFDLVVLDPPREGAREVCHGLPALGAARIVYVSCDPMTLRRDVEILGLAGYRLVRAIPIDLMPQTFHVETVAILEQNQCVNETNHG